eukprot:127317_1
MTDETLHNVWTFIKNNKATDAASLKLLQAFAMSLSGSALKHLIKTYLQSVSAQYSIDKNGLTHKQYVQKISETNDQNICSPLHQSDQEILHKINKTYGKKYNKRIMNIVQQKHAHNPHLLSVTPQIVSYSFQYLSFKELSKITSVCCYFTYLVHNYPALCHYYVDLNQSFFLSAMRNRIHLQQLSHFKSLGISAAYFGSSRMSYRTAQLHKWVLFKHILHRVITQSVSSLNTLKINISHAAGTDMYRRPNEPPSNILLQILTKYDVLYITTLKWFSDYFLSPDPTSHILTQINEKIHDKLPYLEHIVCGINDFQCEYGRRTDVPRSFIAHHIACTVNAYKHLKTLHLKCSKWNIYQNNPNLIALIAQHLTKLEELTIISRIAIDDTSFKMMDAIKHRSLTKLTTEFVCRPHVDYAETVQHILGKLFRVFSGIHSFSFGTVAENCWERRTLLIGLGIDWRLLFSLLISLKYLGITSISYVDASHVLTQLDVALHTLDMCIAFPYFDNGRVKSLIDPFCVFMTKYLMPLVQKQAHYVSPTLKHLKISFGKGQKEYLTTDYFYRCFSFKEPIVPTDVKSFYDPLLALLCNIPTSLQSLHFSLLPTRVYCHSQATKVVQRLSQMSTISDSELTNLESIQLDNFTLKGDAKSFIEFFFGFNNNIHRENKKLYLSFV